MCDLVIKVHGKIVWSEQTFSFFLQLRCCRRSEDLIVEAANESCKISLHWKQNVFENSLIARKWAQKTTSDHWGSPRDCYLARMSCQEWYLTGSLGKEGISGVTHALQIHSMRHFSRFSAADEVLLPCCKAVCSFLNFFLSFTSVRFLGSSSGKTNDPT